MRFKSFYITFIIVIFSVFSNTILAQTTLISPLGNGGFEIGSTFADNGWTATTGTVNPLNHWVCNTSAIPGFSGAKCAYITQTGTNHSYGKANARVSHIFRDVTVPAGESNINLSFSWIGQGESIYDRMRIWLVPISYLPVYGIEIASAGVVPTGQIQFGALNYSLQGAWVNTSISLPASYAGTTFRLVFEWKNDGSFGTNPPAGIDDISLTSALIATPSNNDCPQATLLTVNTTATCTTSTIGTSIGATQSQVGCSGTADDDVWYKFEATATSHDITANPSTISDIVLQIFSGTCGSLTSLACIDNNASSFETSTLTGLSIGTIYYIRVYSYANNGQGSFSMCITTPANPCESIASIALCGSTNIATITPGTGIIGNSSCLFTTPGNEKIFTFTPASTGNYTIQQLSSYTYIDYQLKLASSGCDVTGWTCIDDISGAGTSFPFLLTAGNTYYLLLDPENSVGGNISFILNCPELPPTPCTGGDGTGLTSLGCPSVLSGGLGLNGSDSLPINRCLLSSCVDLEAVYLQLGQTTDYSVESIPYAPPYQFGCLANPVSVNTDDVWSPVINLPFNFCFYGNSYNSCLIGSNGMLTFDTGNALGDTGYAFSNDLPSTIGALFANTIYGVYHDIDPSKGGEVGWELITLNSGCRAMVASWKDVPMFSDNSILYTGMMVLYENTNIIDVYIEEKNIDNNNILPWNDGNAIVGVQNAGATQAVVVPGNNSLDTNWSTTNQAWRFVPSGTSITSVKWYEGAGTTGTLIGNTDIINVCPITTTTYTAEVTYSLCNGTILKVSDETTVNVVGNKVWNGSVDIDWDKDNNWTPIGIPNGSDCVIIPITYNNPIISGIGYNGFAGTLSVLNNASLVINSNNNLSVTDWILIEPSAALQVKNSANLIQINNASINTGNITMERIANMRKADYVYWSSPVENFGSSAISPGTPTSVIWKWNTTIANTNNGLGNWVNGNEIMSVAKGYIVRGPNSFTTAIAPLTATFNGVPFNGIKQPAITRGTYIGIPYAGTNGVMITNTDDNWNLVGNPYPSAIDAISFLTANTNIDGNVRLWTHGTPLSAANTDPFYADYQYNFTVSDYVNYNSMGSTPPGFGGKIGAGQGFFVFMNDGPATTESVTFNNSMRSNTYSNSQFFRTNSDNQAPENPATEEKHRIWLSLVNASNVPVTALVGYSTGATFEKDRLFDAPHKVGTAMGLYSLIGEKSMIIQGRPVPFDNQDQVPLGVTIPNDGTYKIAISVVDGLFDTTDQTIYLEDTTLGIIHDIRVAPYSFTATTGDYKTRFILRYTNQALGNETINQNQTFATINNSSLQIQSNENILEVRVFDIAGKLIKTCQPANYSNTLETDFHFAQGVYFARIKLENGAVVGKKLLH